MNVTEQMVCPICVEKVRKAINAKEEPNLAKSKARYTVSRHTYLVIGKSRVRLVDKINKTEWLLFIKTRGDPRVWSFDKNPNNPDSKATYLGRRPEPLMDYHGIIKPGHSFNPNKILRSYIEIESQGPATLTAKMVNRAEVLLLSPMRGSLMVDLQLTQEEPLSKSYGLEHRSGLIGDHIFSLHRHTWEQGDHYDLRIKHDRGIDEWSTGGDPRQISDSVTALRKTCSDASWMTFSGNRMVSKIPTTSVFLDSGVCSITDASATNISLDFAGSAPWGSYTLNMADNVWKMKKHD